MGKIIEKIKTNTAGMNRQEKLEYIKTYYWYHILGICAAVGLVIFLVVHFGFADRTPEFSCAIINQKIDYDRDKKLASALQKQFADQQINVIVDSDYHFSYKGKKLEDVNEGLFEKFFFKWSNGELQAVLATKDFLQYCVESGGSFYSVKKMDTGTLQLYEENGVSGIQVAGTKLASYLEKDEKNEWVLVFPKEGGDEKACQKIVDFCK